MFEIEKNIPLKSPRHKENHYRYPFLKMEIGDSFFVTCKTEEKRLTFSRVYSAAKHYQDKKFATRSIEDGIRCWRIA